MLKSITEKERIIEIDIIRGIAILGIFFVNFPEMIIKPFERVGYVGVDGFIRLLYNLFIQTKFYTIFSFLFGLGFYIFMSRAEARGGKIYYLFSRRLFFLFVFGVLHFIVFWHGDILNTYALVGIWLLLFYKRKPRTILVWAIILLSITMLFYSTFLSPSFNELIGKPTLQSELEPYNPLRNFGYNISNRFNLFPRFGIVNSIVLTPEILSLFLFGLYAGKIKFFNRFKELLPSLKRAQVISLIISLACFIPMVSTYFKTNVHQLQDQFFFVVLSGKTMAVFYISTILLLLSKDKWQNILKPFSYVGKMALTNYIGQTIVTSIVLSILFKNTASIPLWVSLLYCPLFYIIQVKFSKWWLSTHSMGPLEWVWRYATYYTHN